MGRFAKKKEFRFSFQVFIRLTIFAVIVFLLINYFASSDQKILGADTSSDNSSTIIKDVTDKIVDTLPPPSQEIIHNLDKSPPAIFLQEKVNYLKSQSAGFPQKQISEIQKMIVTTVLKKYLNSLENK